MLGAGRITACRRAVRPAPPEATVPVFDRVEALVKNLRPLPTDLLLTTRLQVAQGRIAFLAFSSLLQALVICRSVAAMAVQASRLTISICPNFIAKIF